MSVAPPHPGHGVQGVAYPLDLPAQADELLGEDARLILATLAEEGGCGPQVRGERFGPVQLAKQRAFLPLGAANGLHLQQGDDSNNEPEDPEDRA